MIALLLLAVDSKVCLRLIESNGVQPAWQDKSSVQIFLVQGGEGLLVIAVEGTKGISPGYLRRSFASFSETKISARWTGWVMVLKT